MKGIIRLRDRTDHGGFVETASSTTIVDGLPAALVGDRVSCPRAGHGTTSIMPGEGHIFSDARQVALHGFKAGCGCMLISSSTGMGE
ncbi:PAAR domain-containing protein [Paraburkholderia sp. BL25I1N1]|uniref:PAAR domain-containing protein n=1 Tax=Paraburkholderia sp. BL25I1N1 TaxID=1938804 RepID=UPI000D080233|nr:PAAR domain-containing protein [Paraburkholderia sp. BL25I1N1]PRY06562.1 putative Zn-binding protein involved in type VI secretion [Paraburkholderia sp. BL25I1N1]